MMTSVAMNLTVEGGCVVMVNKILLATNMVELLNDEKMMTNLIACKKGPKGSNH
jgi:hypothetical protein